MAATIFRSPAFNASAKASKASSGVENEACGTCVEATLAAALRAGAGTDSANATTSASAVGAIHTERVLVLFMIFSG
jgi:hypothetical protein